MKYHQVVAQHFPELDRNGRCVKKVRKEQTRSETRCDKGRDDEIHKYYLCLNRLCKDRFWSIESRLMHMDSRHP